MIALARLIIGTPWMLSAVLITLAAAGGFAKGWSIEHDAKVAALATQDTAWKQAIEKANHNVENEANARVQAALESAAAVQSAPAGIDALKRLCAGDPNCRDEHQPGQQRSPLPRRQAGQVVSK